MGKKLLSLGAIAMDIVINSHDLPKDDGFALINQEQMLPGGSASNVSVSAAHFGMESYQTGKIGDDNIGDEFIRTLKEDGVDAELVAVKKGGTTLHTYILTAPGGKHCIFANTGDTVCTLIPEELPEEIMDSMDIFYNDMFSPKAALWLAKKAVEQGKPVLYNMQCVPSFMEMCGTSREDIEEMMRLCTVFVSGRDGYYEITGEQDYLKAMKMVWEKYQVKEGVICTAGEKEPRGMTERNTGSRRIRLIRWIRQEPETASLAACCMHIFRRAWRRRKRLNLQMHPQRSNACRRGPEAVRMWQLCWSLRSLAAVLFNDILINNMTRRKRS